MTKVEKIKEYLLKELHCPYGEDCNLEVDFVENYDGEVEEIQITTQTWELDIYLMDGSVSFSTNHYHDDKVEHFAVDEYELEYVMDIKDSWEYLKEIIKEEE